MDMTHPHNPHTTTTTPIYTNNRPHLYAQDHLILWVFHHPKGDMLPISLDVIEVTKDPSDTAFTQEEFQQVILLEFPEVKPIFALLLYPEESTPADVFFLRELLKTASFNPTSLLNKSN